MKRTLLFATLSTVFAFPQAIAATELETLRARCTEQEHQIQRLEDQVRILQSGHATQPSAPAKTTAVAKSEAPATALAATHTVRAGDSLERIARRNGCSVAKLAKANGLKSSAMIHPGQKLKLPGAVSTQPVASPPTAAAPVPQSSGKTHKVQAGETFASISRKTCVSVASLVAANPEIKPTALRPGQVIRLSPESSADAGALQSKTVLDVATTPVSRLTSTPVIANKSTHAPAPLNPPQEQSQSPNNPEKKIRSVTIEGEMTYGEFAATHGTDTSRLNDLNGLDLTNATVLAKGSELYVPAQP